jgi:hypothetical protein
MTVEEKIQEQINNFQEIIAKGNLTPESLADKHGNIHGLSIALHIMRTA